MVSQPLRNKMKTRSTTILLLNPRLENNEEDSGTKYSHAHSTPRQKLSFGRQSHPATVGAIPPIRPLEEEQSFSRPYFFQKETKKHHENKGNETRPL